MGEIMKKINEREMSDMVSEIGKETFYILSIVEGINLR